MVPLDWLIFRVYFRRRGAHTPGFMSMFACLCLCRLVGPLRGAPTRIKAVEAAILASSPVRRRTRQCRTRCANAAAPRYWTSARTQQVVFTVCNTDFGIPNCIQHPLKRGQRVNRSSAMLNTHSAGRRPLSRWYIGMGSSVKRGDGLLL